MADVTLDMGQFDSFSGRYARAMNRTLRGWAFETERRAKMRSPIDTGFNANSIYTVVPGGKMMADGQEIAERPTMDDKRYSHRRGKAVYQPGKFAQQAALGGDSLSSIIGSSATVSMSGGHGDGTQASTAAVSDEFAAEVRVGSEYGIYLEMGTVHMKARPFLRPAAEETTPLIDGLAQTYLRREGL